MSRPKQAKTHGGRSLDVVRFSVLLTVEQGAALDELVRQTRVPKAVWFRDAVDLLLKRHATVAKSAKKARKESK